MINRVLSRKGAKFCTFNISNFYLCTPLDRLEYIKIKLSDIPKEFIDEYNLLHHVHNDWGSTLKAAKASMAYPNPASLLKNFWLNIWPRRATTNASALLVGGGTNGILSCLP
jgi:hypothetical protein